MRWILCLIGLLALAACDDDTTGPDLEPAHSWTAAELPAEADWGTVAALAAGGGRLVGLFRGADGDWVIEETPDGWEIVLGRKIPFLPPASAAAREVVYTVGTTDILVGDDGRIHVVGAAEMPGPFGEHTRTPAIWTEADTGWVLTPGPEDMGILLAAEWDAGSGIEAVGVGITTPTVISVSGTPGTGLQWSSSPIEAGGADITVHDLALVGGARYVAGAIWTSGTIPVTPRPLLLSGSEGGSLQPLELPCGACEGLMLSAVEAREAGAFWGGTTVEQGAPGTSPAYRGWLAVYAHNADDWTEFVLPSGIERVYDVLNANGTLFLAVRTASASAIYREQGNGFVPETLPDGYFVGSLLRTPDGRLLGAGSDGQFPGDRYPVVVERE